jgi:hypothetical protein
VIPGPRPSDGQTRPVAGAGDPAPVAVTRTPEGWAVVSATGSQAVADLVEGLSLADLVAEEFGRRPEPDRSARRSARGAAGETAPDDPAAVRIAALERTVAQLEHALAARVATERAIGVLAERHTLSLRAAFEELRRDARSQGRPVAELAREVLDGLPAEAAAVPPVVPGPEPTVAVAAADGRS